MTPEAPPDLWALTLRVSAAGALGTLAYLWIEERLSRWMAARRLRNAGRERSDRATIDVDGTASAGTLAQRPAEGTRDSLD